MQRERVKRLAGDIRRHFPAPRTIKKFRMVKLFSDLRPLTKEEFDERVSRTPRKPDEALLFLNIVQVQSRVQQPTQAAAAGAVDQVRELTTAELEVKVRELEAKKKALLAARRLEDEKRRLVEDRKVDRAETDKKREARVRQVKRVLEDAEERRRR